jgi:hypothetical protein
MPSQLCCYQVSLSTAPVLAVKGDLLDLKDLRPYCTAAEPTKRTPAFDRPRRIAAVDRAILAQVSTHSLIVENRSKKTPILPMKYFDQVVASRLDRPDGDEDIRYVPICRFQDQSWLMLTKTSRWVISPPQSVYGTRTDVIRLQHSSDIVNDKCATVLYRLFDERKTHILESFPNGGHLERPESLSGSIIHLGSSYKPLTAESLAFFRQNRHALQPGAPTQGKNGSLLILAPSGSKCNPRERTLEEINRILDTSRPDSETLPISSIRLAKASARQTYQPGYLTLLTLDLIRLCSHHCARDSAPPRLTITDIKLKEIDLVVDAVSFASSSKMARQLTRRICSSYAKLWPASVPSVNSLSSLCSATMPPVSKESQKDYNH